MLIGVAFIKMMWEIYQDLILLGKVLLFPLLFIGLVGFIIFGICETFLIDIWVFLMALLSKSLTVRDICNFYWD